jgi:hypothetical protein
MEEPVDPSVRLALVCDYALKSQDDKLSVLGIFSQINVQDIPASSPPFFVVVSIAMDIGNHEVRIGVLNPIGGSAIPETPQFEVDVEQPGATTDVLLQFNSLPLERAGIYQIQVFVDGVMIHSVPLHVQSMSQPGFPPSRA